MPTYTTTARHALRRLVGTNVISDTDVGIAALADDVDAIVATDDQGTLAGRPVSTPGSPGVTGRYYRDDATGLVYRDHGTGWAAVSGFVAGLLSARPLASTMPGAAFVSTDTEELSYALQDGSGFLEVAGRRQIETVLPNDLAAGALNGTGGTWTSVKNVDASPMRTTVNRGGDYIPTFKVDIEILTGAGTSQDQRLVYRRGAGQDVVIVPGTGARAPAAIGPPVALLVGDIVELQFKGSWETATLHRAFTWAALELVKRI